MHISETFANVHALSSVLKCTPEDLVDRISHVLEQNKELEKTIKAYQQTALSNQVAGLIKTKQKTASGSEYIKSVVNVETSEGLKSLANQLLPELNAGLVLLAAELKGKIQICASVSNEAIEQGFHAGNIVQAVCQLLDGKGGGKNNFAMGGAPQNKAFKDILSSFEI
jgi:alanyl-tRNA synthetase